MSEGHMDKDSGAPIRQDGRNEGMTTPTSCPVCGCTRIIRSWPHGKPPSCGVWCWECSACNHQWDVEKETP